MKNVSRVIQQTSVLFVALFCVSKMYAWDDGYVDTCTSSGSHTLTLSIGFFGLGGSWSITTNLYECKLIPASGGYRGTIHPVHPFKGAKVNTAVASCPREGYGVPVVYQTHALVDFLIPLSWIPPKFHAAATVAKRTIKLMTGSSEYLDVQNESFDCELIPGRPARR